MSIATKFDNKNKTFYKAVIDEDRNRFSISGWPIRRKEDRANNKRIFYYQAHDLNDLLSMMLTIAPFKKSRTVIRDAGFQLKQIKQTPWIWK